MRIKNLRWTRAFVLYMHSGRMVGKVWLYFSVLSRLCVIVYIPVEDEILVAVSSWIYMFLVTEHNLFNLRGNLVPRLFLRGRKDPGRSWSRDAYKIDCLRGYGQSVKLRTLPLLDFTLPLQGASVLYNRLWESHIFQNTCLIWFLITFQLWLHVKQICIATDKSGNQEIKM